MFTLIDFIKIAKNTQLYNSFILKIASNITHVYREILSLIISSYIYFLQIKIQSNTKLLWWLVAEDKKSNLYQILFEMNSLRFENGQRIRWLKDNPINLEHTRASRRIAGRVYVYVHDVLYAYVAWKLQNDYHPRRGRSTREKEREAKREKEREAKRGKERQRESIIEFLISFPEWQRRTPVFIPAYVFSISFFQPAKRISLFLFPSLMCVLIFYLILYYC